MYPSTTAIGKTIRMNRIFQKDGRALMVAINHGLGTVSYTHLHIEFAIIPLANRRFPVC